MSIGKRLKELRINSGLTQSEVAKDIGVAIQTIFKYENEIVTNIPSDKIEKLAKVFDTTPEYIMGWKSDNKSENKPDNAELEEDVTQPQQSEFDILYNQLDQEDKIELRGIIKGMLHADKYKKTNSIADDINNMMKAAENLGIKQK